MAKEDRWGSRCRNERTGRWAPCEVCGVCETKDSVRVKRRERHKKRLPNRLAS